MSKLQLGLFNFRIRGQHPLQDPHGNRVPEVVLQQQAPLSRIGQVSRLHGDGWDIGADPELGLGGHAVIRDLKAPERLGQPGIDRLRERKAVGLWVEDGQAVDRRVAIVGVDMQADEHPGAGRMRAVPALRDLDVLIAAAGQHDLDTLALQQGAQPQGQVECDVLLHDGADHDPGVPELRGVAGWAATVPWIDRDHVGRGHDE